MSRSAPASRVGGATAVLADELAVIHGALTALSEVDPAELSATGLGEHVLALLTARRRIDGVLATITARFEAGGDWQHDGARSPEAWIRSRTVDGYGPAKAVVEQGTWSRSFPLMHAALAEGRVSVKHVRCLADAHRRFPRLSTGLSAQEAAIVDLAAACEPRAFERHLLDLCHRLDPDAVDEAMEDARRQDYLNVSTSLNGRVRVDAWLPADLGSQLLAALEAAKRAVKAPADAGPNTPSQEVRPASERNLDALRRILSAAASVTGEEGLPMVAGARSVVHITVPIDALTGSDPQVMAFLERAGVPHAAVSAITTAQATCDATLSPWVVTRTGKVLAQLPTVRTISPAMRRAITTRDHHCRFPGCRARIDEIHHIVFWRHGGRTERSNLVGLCWHHHHLIHHQHWRIHGDPEQALTFVNERTSRHEDSEPGWPGRGIRPPGFGGYS